MSGKIHKYKSQAARLRDLNNGIPYQVRKGDNLNKISLASGISIHDLAKDNNLKNPNIINEGDTIFLIHHHKPEDAINSDSMNEDFMDLRDQVFYLEDVEDEALDRYHKVAKNGAQKYIDENQK